MDNEETMTTLGTQDTGRKQKTTEKKKKKIKPNQKNLKNKKIK